MEHGARLNDGRLPRLTTAAQAAARDHAAIRAGISSFDLMQQAAACAAATVLREYADRLAYGVAIFAGAGNNGGDAYLVAAQLARAGVAARLHGVGIPRTRDAQRAALLAAPWLTHGEPTGRERVVVDGVLGTGHRGALRAPAASVCARIDQFRDVGAAVVALDLPSGLDATNGDVAEGAVTADLTICFGTLKRGVLRRRDRVGRIVLADIGLNGFADRPGDEDDGAWAWADHATLAARVPRIGWDAHKGRRGRVALIGGDAGMAGAITLATRAALAAGAGLAHAMVDEASVAAVQAAVPQALAASWPPVTVRRRGDGDANAEQANVDSANAHSANAEEAPRFDALGIGPGLGRTRAAAQQLESWLRRFAGRPVVLDADALWLVADAAAALATDAATVLKQWTRDATAVVCTPHPGEFARLHGAPLPTDWEELGRVLGEFAARSGATVLLKGAPTLVVTPGLPPVAVPYGTPALATGGSGDCLTGIITTLLGQGMAAHEAAMVGAGVHGLAAEHATAAVGHVRGLTLDGVLGALPAVWAALAAGRVMPPGVLAMLPPASTWR